MLNIRNLLIRLDPNQPAQEEKVDLSSFEDLQNNSRRNSGKFRRDNIFAIIFFSINSGLILSYFILGFLAWQQDLLWRADFTMFYTGGAIVREGHYQQLYNLEVQRAYQLQILDGRSMQDGVLMFNYPPYIALAFSPLALLPLSAAYWVWMVFQFGLVVWLVSLLNSLSNMWNIKGKILLLTCVLALHFLLLNFLLGALSLLLLICLIYFYYYLKIEKDYHGGVFYAFNGVKPQNALALVFLLLAARRWKAIAGALTVILPVVLITIVVGGWRVWLDYINLLLVAGSSFDQFGINPEAMYNLKGFLTAALGPKFGHLINRISWAGFIFFMGLVLLLWKSKWDPHHPAFELRFGFTVLAGLLFSPHLNPQDGLILVFPALLFYIYLKQRKKGEKTLAAFLLLCPLLFVISEYTIGSSLGIRIPTLVMILLLVWMGIMLVEEKKRSADQVINGSSFNV
jgi:hypothetical protein